MSDFGKNRVLALYKILTAYTDELHQISMQDILVHMEAEGYSCSEDSILRYIKQLRNELGVDVISGRGRNARYFIGNRLLEKEEMKLIIDSVNASNFIEKSIATKMIDKLKSTMSLYDAEELDRSVLGINTAKAENKKILYNVNLIQEALSKGVQISFDYMVWDRNKKLVKKSDRRYNMNPYDFVEDKHRGAQNQVEGLMYSDIDNIHAILLTREKTLPNISALMNTLMETDAKERVSKELLLEAIDDFEKDNIDSRECISEWKSKVAAETEMITKKALKKILNMRTGIASKFNRFLHEKYGVWIDGELRKGEFEATYQIGNLLNIKYEYNEKDYLDGRTFVYYVGAKSKRLAYPNACCMRKVISLGEELEYEEALPLMAVEFVRNSQYTVLPFPFKYLREYIKQC